MHRPVILVGHSMGSRVGLHAALAPGAAAAHAIAGVVCLSFPLIGANGDMRDAVLRAAAGAPALPVLLCQGTRDRMSPRAQLAPLVALLRAGHPSSELHEVVDGDHALTVSKTYCKREGTTQERVDAATVCAIRTFIAAITTRV